MGILKFIIIILEVIVLFNLIIIVHELGHFLAAKWRGLYIERFGVWFGKPLWERTIGGVKYSLGSIPAGGFVALPQMAPMEALEGDSDVVREDLPQASVLDRIIVAAAGPLFSVLLAFAFAGIISLVGRPVSESERSAVVGYLPEGSPAAAAGLLPGDKILSVDGFEVSRFNGVGKNSVQWRVISGENETVDLTYERDGETLSASIVPQAGQNRAFGRDTLRRISALPITTPIVDKPIENTPAEAAGLLARDIIRAVNGEPVYHPAAVNKFITDADVGTPLTFTVERDGSLQEIEIASAMITPEGATEAIPMIGIQWDLGGIRELGFPSPMEQVRASVDTMFSTLGALFSPKSEVKAEHLSGPAGIMNLYYRLFESENGWRLAIWFSVVFNINLAILNMLPIPVLDGGHITLALIEGAIRRPINVKILQAVQTGCAALLIGFMIYVTFFDVQDVFNLNPAKDPAVEETTEPIEQE